MRPPRRDDRGSVVVLSGLLMVILLGMCAFAIDVGHVYNVRRQAQSSVDTAALAGGAELTRFMDAQSTRRQRAAAWVKANSYRSAEITPPSPDEWNQAWATCTDEDHLPITSSASAALSDPEWPAAGASECISFSPDMRTIRVKLPDQVIRTAFGGLFGVDHMSTRAIAEVELSPGDMGGILPFALYSAGMDTGATLCMATSSNLKTGYPFDVCDEGSTSGNFGTLNIAVWGNANMPMDCASGTSGGDDRLKANIAEGIDHMVMPQRDGDPELFDFVECAGERRTPNRLMTRTGNQFAVLPPGLIDGITYNGNYYTGRLTRGTGAMRRAYNTSPAPIDDVALWEYLNPELRGGREWEVGTVPPDCDAATFRHGWTPEQTPHLVFDAYPAYLVTPYQARRNGGPFIPGALSRLHMETCMEQYNAWLDAGKDTMPPLFTDELGKSARLGWLPILEGLPPSGTNEYKRVLDFQAIYINTLFGNCNPHGCDQVWEPGEVSSGQPERANTSLSNSSALAAVGAYQFRTEMLPVSVQDTNPTYGGGFDGVQLSR